MRFHPVWNVIWIVPAEIALLATALQADTVDEVVGDLDAYAAVDFLDVSTGSVKAREFGTKGWYVLVQVPPADEPTPVKRVHSVWSGSLALSFRSLRAGAGRALDFHMDPVGARPAKAEQVKPCESASYSTTTQYTRSRTRPHTHSNSPGVTRRSRW